MYLCIYVHMYINASSFLVLHGMSNVKHSSATICRLAPSSLPHTSVFSDATSSWPCLLCKRALHKRARSQTLKDIGRLCCARQHGGPLRPGLVWLLALSAWFWWMPDELKRACRVHTAASPPHPWPHLVYLGTFWIWWRKNNQLQIKWCARQHIYTS